MKLNPIFSSNMVFAHSRPIVVFGTGAGTVKVDFCGSSVEKTVESESWQVSLPPMECGGPYQMDICLNGEKIALENVYVGEVYLCAGQSNMQFKVHESDLADSKKHSNEHLRSYSTERIEPPEYFFPKDGWVTCKKDEVDKWSLLGYLIGDEASKRKNAVVGTINCFQGASVIESWIPKGLLFEKGIDIPIGERHKDHIDEWFGKWNNEAFLYEFALKQVIPYQINAVIWYQGESDTSVVEAKVYADELKIMIDRWREDFDDENLPFVIIQIADYHERMDEGWRLVQEAQLKIQDMTHGVTTVICRDVCENTDIHPKNKEILANRVVEALM